MRSLANELRLPINDSGYFRQGNHRHRITNRGWQTLHLLAELYKCYAAGTDRNCLIRARRIIRQLDKFASAACLNFVIRRTKLGRLRLLAVWIRGRVGGTLGSSRFEGFANHPNPRVRKEIARAAKRMSAWKLLRQMVHNERLRADCCERVIRMATTLASERRPFSDRLAKTISRVRREETTPHETKTFVADSVNTNQPHPPKRGSLIGRVLMRIRSLVRRSPFAERV